MTVKVYLSESFFIKTFHTISHGYSWNCLCRETYSLLECQKAFQGSDIKKFR